MKRQSERSWDDLYIVHDKKIKEEGLLSHCPNSKTVTRKKLTLPQSEILIFNYCFNKFTAYNSSCKY